MNEKIQVDKKKFVAKTLAVNLAVQALSGLLPESKERIAKDLMVLAVLLVEKMTDEDVEEILSHEKQS